MPVYKPSKAIEPNGEWCEHCHALATEIEVCSYDDTDLWLCESCHDTLLYDAQAERNHEHELMQQFL